MLPRTELNRIPLASSPVSNLQDGCPERFDSTYDYFPEKVTFQYAKQLQIEYHGSYKLVSFTPAVNTKENFHYAFYQCGTPPPAVSKHTRLISVPARRFILNDPGYGSAIVRLGLLPRMTGVSSFRSFSEPHIVAAAQAGQLQEVGSSGHSTLENAVAVDPDLVFLFYSAYPNANLHPKLWEAGVEAVPLADHFEPTALGRAEWIKFAALIFNREKEANQLFAPLVDRYEALTARASSVVSRPRVLLGYGTGRDIWSLNGGRNFMAHLIRDGGGDYFWKDDKAGSIVQADYEKVLDLASETNTWLGGANLTRAKKIATLLNNNPRLAFLQPVTLGNVYAADRGLDKRGAFPFADQSLDRPDELLGDVIEALHPELLPDRHSVFYRRLN